MRTEHGSAAVPLRVAIMIGSTREGLAEVDLPAIYPRHPGPAVRASGQPRDAAGCTAAATTMLDELAWWATALRRARAPVRRTAMNIAVAERPFTR